MCFVCGFAVKSCANVISLKVWLFVLMFINKLVLNCQKKTQKIILKKIFNKINSLKANANYLFAKGF